MGKARRPVAWLAGVALLALTLGAWWWQRSAPAGAAAAGVVAAAGASSAGASAGATPARAGGSGGSAGPGRGGPPAVEVAPVQTAPIAEEAQAVGTLAARQRVVIRPEVAGRIVAFGFADGAPVRKGQLLVQLDDALQRAELAQAQAQLAVQQANLRRNEELVAQGFVAQRVLDESRAAVQVAQAQVDLAQARLARMRIVAPFDGVAGIRAVHVGEYVKDGAELVHLEDLSQLVVDFRLPERLQPRVRVGQPLRLQVDARPGQTVLARIVAIDPALDADGRALVVRAALDGGRHGLQPGMFVRVALELGRDEAALLVPEEAIVPQGQQFFVWRLRPAAGDALPEVERVAVRLGLRRDGQVQVTQGLQAGDTIVIAGQQRLQRDGTPVRVIDPNRPGPGGPAGAGGGNGQPHVGPSGASSAAQPGGAPGAGGSAGGQPGGAPARVGS
ncbi:Multidrug resistance protein MdtA [Tepidimonas alkaliphilus]|uniref:Multidrug resistance protein MdtA n=1 Tax=Tepidimonas alkaliphilus TaxID=2588942 RepID=A0A554WA66_9BURK|nr:efflux RND transporter periplasmic adaptor subunit [Tepidimonas alkaliphilus]TSE20440.1 Multidrug resistance protein MdtA [Tepidimonas alkaliphilus]